MNKVVWILFDIICATAMATGIVGFIVLTVKTLLS